MADSASDIIAIVQASVDKTGIPELMAAFGTPGSKVTITFGSGDSKTEVKVDTGSAWSPTPTAFTELLQGFGFYFDKITYLPQITPKLNELIGEYNKLRSDYNNGVVPTSAKAVSKFGPL